MKILVASTNIPTNPTNLIENVYPTLLRAYKSIKSVEGTVAGFFSSIDDKPNVIKIDSIIVDQYGMHVRIGFWNNKTEKFSYLPVKNLDKVYRYLDEDFLSESEFFIQLREYFDNLYDYFLDDNEFTERSIERFKMVHPDKNQYITENIESYRKAFM